MRKQAVSSAAGSPIQWLEQIAHLVCSARSPALLLERVLQLLGDALEAMAGAVVLVGEAARRSQGWSWGTYQQQMVEVGRELVQGLEAHSAATARSTVLPGTTGETAPAGVLLAVPLRGLQQALGVLVFFCPGQPAPALETVLAFLELTGTYVVLVTNRVDWGAQRIIALSLQRWPIETFYQDGKTHLGLDEYRMRSAEAIKKHWCLVFVAYSFLHLDCLPPSPTKGSLPIKTIGEACRQQAQALMQALILYAHEHLQLGQRVEDIFGYLFAKQQPVMAR